MKKALFDRLSFQYLSITLLLTLFSFLQVEGQNQRLKDTTAELLKIENLYNYTKLKAEPEVIIARSRFILDSLNDLTNLSTITQMQIMLRSYFHIADNLYTLGKIDSVFTYLIKSEDLINKTADSAYYGRVKRLTAKALNKSGMLDSAIQISQNLEKYALIKQDSALLINNLNDRGNFFAKKGNYAEATVLYESVVKITEKRRKWFEAFDIAYSNLSAMYIYQSQYDKALQMLESYRNNPEFKLSDSDYASNYINTGAIYYYTGNLYKAADCYQKAIQHSEKSGDRVSSLTGESNLGHVYLSLGIYDKALKSYEKTRRSMVENNIMEGYSIVLNNLGILYSETGNSLFADSLQRMAIYFSMKEPNPSINGIAAYNLALRFLENYQIDSAQKYVAIMEKVSETTQDKRLIANMLTCRGLISDHQGKLEESSDYYTRAYNLGIEIQDFFTYQQALTLLSENSISRKNFAMAKFYLNEKYKQLKLSILSNFFSLNSQDVHDYVTKISVECNNFYSAALRTDSTNTQLASQALDIALLIKDLHPKMISYINQIQTNSLPSELEKEIISYKEFCASYSNQPLLVDTGKYTFENYLKQEEKFLNKLNASGFFSEILAITGKEVRSKLPEKSVAIEFIRFRKSKPMQPSEKQYGYMAILNYKDDQRTVCLELCKESELAFRLGSNLSEDKAKVESQYGNLFRPSEELYNLVWKKLDSHLTGIKTIYLSAEGLLGKLNFAAITTPSGGYLGDKYAIHVMSTTADCIKLVEGPGIIKPGRALVIGGIDYGENTTGKTLWQSIPGTLKEAHETSNQLLKRNFAVSTFTGNQACKNTFKHLANECKIIHLSTHGFFFPDPSELNRTEEILWKKGDESILAIRGLSESFTEQFVYNKDPMKRSGLVFCNANNKTDYESNKDYDNGLLTASEIKDMNLSWVELVVLSACETGLGESKGSQGLYGLQKAFQMAGAKNIIASLWKVPDAETSLFMQTFYQFLTEGFNPFESINKTRKEFKEKYDPYYWAAFVLIE